MTTVITLITCYPHPAQSSKCVCVLSLLCLCSVQFVVTVLVFGYYRVIGVGDIAIEQQVDGFGKEFLFGQS